MKIDNNYSPNFGLKFINNSAYKEVKQYAYKINDGEHFEKIIRRLEKAIEGDVLIIHGIDEKGKHYSMFKRGNIIVENTPYYYETYIETTYRAIRSLTALGGRYRELTNTNNVRMV